jgi:hypothetical protein
MNVSVYRSFITATSTGIKDYAYLTLRELLPSAFSPPPFPEFPSDSSLLNGNDPALTVDTNHMPSVSHKRSVHITCITVIFPFFYSSLSTSVPSSNVLSKWSLSFVDSLPPRLREKSCKLSFFISLTRRD